MVETRPRGFGLLAQAGTFHRRAHLALIEEVKRDPFRGMGKPEPLKHTLAGFWSRRITKEHRLVYRVEVGVIYIA